MTQSALTLNNTSFYTALVGVLGRSRRVVSYEIDDRGYLMPSHAADMFAPAKGEAIEAFLRRVFASAMVAEGDTVDATISNGALVGITVTHVADDDPLLSLDLDMCRDAWRALVMVLANGYGRLSWTVADGMLLLAHHDLTLRLERDETLDAFIVRVSRSGVWARGDAVHITSDGNGKLNTIRITRR